MSPTQTTYDPNVLGGHHAGASDRNHPARVVVSVRAARRHDLPAIVAMLADDILGATRENPADMAPYERAFTVLEADPRNLLLAGEDEAGTVVASLQLTFIPTLGDGGAERALISGVRVASHLRCGGIGRQLLNWGIRYCRRRGCAVIELMSHHSRADAVRFYETLGFARSHTGMHLRLR
jgi:GNAT superfamily N-acetyltransferase